MRISLIGTNGLLSNAIGKYCNINNIEINAYGLKKPITHKYKNFKFIDLRYDIIDYKLLCQSDIVIYAVGAGIQSNLHESVDLIYSLNVQTPIRLYNKLKHENYTGAFLSFGSYFEIGENRDNHCFNEIELLQSQRKVFNDYSISKRLFSRYISSVEMPFKTWHFILPTIYGENEAPHRLIPYTIQALKTNGNIAFTSGEQIRQYIYIDEVVEVIFQVYLKDIPYGLYNIPGAETLSVKELVTKLSGFYGIQLSDRVFGKTERTDTGMKNLQLNGYKLYNAICYQPQVKLIDVYDRY